LLEIPLLFDLPFRTSDPGGGGVNTWFDHQYPQYSREGNAHRTTLVPWWGHSIVAARRDYEPTGSLWYSGHNGIDFNVRGDILAAADGRVAFADKGSGINYCYGNYVLLDHDNGYWSLYGHLNSIESGIKPRTGQPTPTVVRGQKSGTAGTTPGGNCSNGIHLHFSVFYSEDGDIDTSDLVYSTFAVDPFGFAGTLEFPVDPWLQHGGPPSFSLLSPYLPVAGFSSSSTDTQLALNDGTVVVDIPAGTFGGLAQITLQELPPLSSGGRDDIGGGEPVASTVFDLAPQDLLSANHSFTLSARDSQGNPIGQVQRPIAVTIRYTDADGAGIREGTLSLYHWDTVSHTWMKVATTLDSLNNTARADTSQLGLFALLGQRAPAIYLPLVMRNAGAEGQLTGPIIFSSSRRGNPLDIDIMNEE